MTPAEEEEYFDGAAAAGGGNGNGTGNATGNASSPLKERDLGFDGGASGTSDSEDTPLATADALAAVDALSAVIW